MLYKLSVWNTGASYGAKLQNLKYVVPNTRKKQLPRPSISFVFTTLNIE